MEHESERVDTHGEGVSSSAEGAVDEGAKRAGPAEGGEDLAKQDGDVVLVGAPTVQVGVEGGRGTGAPLEVLLQRPPPLPLAALAHLRLGLGFPHGLARDRVMLSAAVWGRDGNTGGDRARVEMQGEEASDRRHCRHGRSGRGAARGVDKTRRERERGRVAVHRPMQNGWSG